jgi:hypothetical protein
MTKFYKPSKNKLDYYQLSEIAIRRALRDANMDFK